jgi:hypothetical protein
MTRGLVVARYLYQSGVQQSHQSGFRRATAVLTFHDAVEVLLVLGLQHHDLYNPKKLYAFAEYWTVFEANQVPLTQFGAMQRLNTARVNLKHHASLPGPEVVEEARIQSRIFFVENTPIIFGENFEEISLASLVTSSEKARAHLVSADSFIVAADYDNALGEIAYAMHRLLNDHEVRRSQARRRVYLGLGKLYRHTGKPDQAREPPHHRDDDVPRDGHDVLAGAGGTGDPRPHMKRGAHRVAAGRRLFRYG